jgi:hypothetical protein
VVASPNLTLTVTPPGGSPTDYTSKLAWSGGGQTPTITQHFGRQGDTAVLPLVDEYSTSPNFYIPAFSQVRLVDNTVGATLFAGVANDPLLDVTGTNRNDWSLQCTDYAFYADNALVTGTFYGMTVDQIVVTLTQQANCGITAATVANGGFVAPGPQLASFVLNYTTLSAAWRKLATLAGQVTPYGWYVDENRNLHFYDATTAVNSGVTFTTTPTGTGGSLTEGHFLLGSGFGYEWDGTSVRNRILVQGAAQTVFYGTTNNTPTDTWQGNGTQNAWPLRYTVTGNPVLQVNGIVTPVTVVSSGAAGSGTWQVVQNAVGGWSLTNSVTAPTAGVVIKIWYNYQVPVVAQANDFGSQATYNGPNGGIYAEYINDSSLTTLPMALNRAQRQRTEYAYAAERLTFSTSPDWLGWVRAGDTCQIVNRFIPDSENSYAWGINDTFIVVSNSVTFGAGGYRTCSITAVRI